MYFSTIFLSFEYSFCYLTLSGVTLIFLLHYCVVIAFLFYRYAIHSISAVYLLEVFMQCDYLYTSGRCSCFKCHSSCIYTNLIHSMEDAQITQHRGIPPTFEEESSSRRKLPAQDCDEKQLELVETQLVEVVSIDGIESGGGGGGGGGLIQIC